MQQNPCISIIIPTRNRLQQLANCCASLLQTMTFPNRIELILVIDEDDPESQHFAFPELQIRKIVVAPGQTMGSLNQMGFEASRGNVLMLLNDDVIAETPGWDQSILRLNENFSDGIYLIHVNDTLMRDQLCTFPVLSRLYCELAGGICPTEYHRYCIDDHIEDVFNRLQLLGENRIVYLPEVVFRHHNAKIMPEGHLEYHADPKMLPKDEAILRSLSDCRKSLALQLYNKIQQYKVSMQIQKKQTLLGPKKHQHGERRKGHQRIASMRSLPNSLTVCMVTTNIRHATVQKSLAALRKYSPPFDLILKEINNDIIHFPREYNQILQTLQADRIVLIDDCIVVGPGWFQAMQHHLDNTTSGVVPANTYGVMLLDGNRGAIPDFDDGYKHFFWYFDYFLQSDLLGGTMKSVDVPVRRFKQSPILDYLWKADEQFEQDRMRFITKWCASLQLMDSVIQQHLDDYQTSCRPSGLYHLIQSRKVKFANLVRRIRYCVKTHGLSGLFRAVSRRLFPSQES